MIIQSHFQSNMFSYILLLFAFLRIFLLANTQAEFVSVNVTNGTLLGSWSGGVAKFSNIPYASPPLDDLRFEPPKPALAWNGTLNVSSDHNVACPQPMFFPGLTLPTTEDCLVLHVLTPNISGNLPVLVWIHGGGYVFGYGSGFPLDGLANNLANRSLVVVAINYRLNVLGFFTSLNAEFPGNMGMLDQVLALRWVQAEISKFGGNPEAVTIFGESAGASSVSLLTYSPLAKGLFKRAFMESGTAYVGWAWNGVNGFYDETSQRLAITLNCSTAAQWNSGQNFQAIVKCLRQKTPDQLVNAATGVSFFHFQIFSAIIHQLLDQFYSVSNMGASDWSIYIIFAENFSGVAGRTTVLSCSDGQYKR